MSPSLAVHYREILVGLGENPERERLLDTPKRAAQAMQYLCNGYTMSLEDVINGALFESQNDEMVIVRDIELYSLCEHHMLPFIGKAHVAYIGDADKNLDWLCREAQALTILNGTERARGKAVLGKQGKRNSIKSLASEFVRECVGGRAVQHPRRRQALDELELRYRRTKRLGRGGRLQSFEIAERAQARCDAPGRCDRVEMAEQNPMGRLGFVIQVQLSHGSVGHEHAAQPSLPIGAAGHGARAVQDQGKGQVAAGFAVLQQTHLKYHGNAVHAKDVAAIGGSAFHFSLKRRDGHDIPLGQYF